MMKNSRVKLPAACQQTEGRPLVVDVHQVEEAGHHGNLGPQRH